MIAGWKQDYNQLRPHGPRDYNLTRSERTGEARQCARRGQAIAGRGVLEPYAPGPRAKGLRSESGTHGQMTNANGRIAGPGADTPAIPRRLFAAAWLCIPGVYAVLVLCYASMIAIGAGVMFGLWFIIDRWLQWIPPVALLVPGVGMIVSFSFAVAGTVRAFRTAPRFAPALLVDLNKEARFGAFIADVSTTIMKTAPPDVVIFHAEPVFFVERGTLRVFNGEARGRILAVGLPVLSFISVNELRAILAHEFAHFTGDDTAFSMTIMPVYTRLATRIEAMGTILGAGRQDPASRRNVGCAGLALILPWFTLNVYWTLFHRLNAKISRFRERRADMLAAEACGSEALKTALGKVNAILGRFSEVFEATFLNKVRDGQTLLNYCSALREAMPIVDGPVPDQTGNRGPEAGSADESHPRLQERLDSVPGVVERFSDRQAAQELIGNLSDYEREMTLHLMESRSPGTSPPAPPAEETVPQESEPEGHLADATTVICPACGAGNAPGFDTCGECGTELRH